MVSKYLSQELEVGLGFVQEPRHLPTLFLRKSVRKTPGFSKGMFKLHLCDYCNNGHASLSASFCNLYVHCKTCSVGRILAWHARGIRVGAQIKKKIPINSKMVLKYFFPYLFTATLPQLCTHLGFPCFTVDCA